MLADQTTDNPGIASRSGLEHVRVPSANRLLCDLETADLIEHVVTRQEGRLAENGAMVVGTGQFTGRSPKDKFIVRDRTTDSDVHWGSVNQPMSPGHFDTLYSRAQAFLEDKELFAQNLRAGADPEYSLSIRVVTQLAWHSLFARQLLIRPSGGHSVSTAPDFTLLFVPAFQADPGAHGTRSGTSIAINFSRKLVLIVGTFYAGELKKSVFTILNHLLPDRGVMPMHCSANVGRDGRVALFFGLSGTGKTTLSTDPERSLIGDDEHGWSDRGVFNFEGGCYAKCIRLSREQEPQIWNAIRFGTVLENVVMDSRTRSLDFNSSEITENTRAAYPVEFIENAVIPSVAGHPHNVIFLTADAFGVLPPIARLTPEQATYHFLSGYTAKVAGTERGLGREPEATFSACFAAPFLTRRPGIYANLLGEKVRKHGVACWLVNTGWAGGPYGIGHRMKLEHTRAMIHAAVSGQLDDVPMAPDSVFRVLVPKTCPNIPAALLDARGMWQDKSSYDRAGRDLAARFKRNFEKFSMVSAEVLAAGPGI